MTYLPLLRLVMVLNLPVTALHPVVMDTLPLRFVLLMSRVVVLTVMVIMGYLRKLLLARCTNLLRTFTYLTLAPSLIPPLVEHLRPPHVMRPCRRPSRSRSPARV